MCWVLNNRRDLYIPDDNTSIPLIFRAIIHMGKKKRENQHLVSTARLLILSEFCRGNFRG